MHTLLASPNDPMAGLNAVVPLAIVIGIAMRFWWLKRHRKTQASPRVIVRPIHPLITLPKVRAASSTRSQTRTLPIDKIRELLGPAPRTFAPNVATYVQITPPSWLKKNDEMSLQYEHQQRIREKGQVVWATYAQVNKLMFSPGTTDSGGSMVYSPDPWFDTHPEELGRIARELFSLKNTEQEDPEAATFARMLTNELIRAMRLQVPRRFTGGREVYHSAMLFARKHLPKGYVSGNLLPVWIDPGNTGALIMVPAAYWPASLLAYWDPDLAKPPVLPTKT